MAGELRAGRDFPKSEALERIQEWFPPCVFSLTVAWPPPRSCSPPTRESPRRARTGPKSPLRNQLRVNTGCLPLLLGPSELTEPRPWAGCPGSGEGYPYQAPAAVGLQGEPSQGGSQPRQGAERLRTVPKVIQDRDPSQLTARPGARDFLLLRGILGRGE